MELSSHGSKFGIDEKHRDPENYSRLQNVAEVMIYGMGYEDHLEYPPPGRTDAAYMQCRKHDAQLQGLLFNVMNPSIKEICISLSTSREILQSRFSVGESKVYDILCAFTTRQQGDQGVQNHYSDLFSRFHHFVEIIPFFNTGDMHRVNLEKIGVIQYLFKLSVDFSHLRDEIVGSGQLSSLAEVVTHVECITSM